MVSTRSFSEVTGKEIVNLIDRIKRVEIKVGITNGERIGSIMGRIENLEKKLGISLHQAKKLKS